MAEPRTYTKTYNCFSGLDILVVPGERRISAITYTTKLYPHSQDWVRDKDRITGQIALRNEDPDDATLEQLLKKTFSVKLRGRNEYGHLMVMFINDIEICAGSHAPWEPIPFVAQTLVPWHAGKVD
jgi:hypothetical protein